MEEYIFVYKSPTNKENTYLKFEVDSPGGVQIATFHRYCKRAASAFGYVDENIKNTFGDSYYFEDFY